VARVRVIGADGTAVPVHSGPIDAQADIAPGTSGTLVLAEAAGGWSATLNGKPLAAVAAPVDGWAQGWVLPAGGGRLVITRDETARDLSLAAEAVAVLVVFALALPGTRSAVPAPAAEAETGPQPETTQAPGRRRDRASGPRLARRQPQPQPELALAGSRAPGADGVGLAEFPAADVDLPDPGPSDVYPDPGPSDAYPDPGPSDAHPDPGPSDVHPDPGPSGAYPDPVPSGAYDPGPAPGTEPRADDGVSPGPAPAVAAAAVPDFRAGPPSGPPRRSRGGQHAARHGKPSRRWRGRPAAPPAAGPSEAVRPPAVTASGLNGTAQDGTRENPGFHQEDDPGEVSALALPDPTATDSRPPWAPGDPP